MEDAGSATSWLTDLPEKMEFWAGVIVAIVGVVATFAKTLRAKIQELFAKKE